MWRFFLYLIVCFFWFWLHESTARCSLGMNYVYMYSGTIVFERILYVTQGWERLTTWLFKIVRKSVHLFHLIKPFLSSPRTSPQTPPSHPPSRYSFNTESWVSCLLLNHFQSSIHSLRTEMLLAVAHMHWLPFGMPAPNPYRVLPASIPGNPGADM
jgi:hypothetical protein